MHTRRRFCTLCTLCTLCTPFLCSSSFRSHDAGRALEQKAWSRCHVPCHSPRNFLGTAEFCRICSTQEQKSDLAGKCESKNPPHTDHCRFLLPVHYARRASFFAHCCLTPLHVNIHQEQVAELASLSGTWKYSIVVSHHLAKIFANDLSWLMSFLSVMSIQIQHISERICRLLSTKSNSGLQPALARGAFIYSLVDGSVFECAFLPTPHPQRLNRTPEYFTHKHRRRARPKILCLQWSSVMQIKSVRGDSAMNVPCKLSYLFQESEGFPLSACPAKYTKRIQTTALTTYQKVPENTKTLWSKDRQTRENVDAQVCWLKHERQTESRRFSFIQGPGTLILS